VTGPTFPDGASEPPASPALIDAHAHLDEYGDEELDRVRGELAEHRILTISTAMDPASYRRAQAVAGGCRLILPTFGIHPWKAPDWADRLDEIDRLIADSPMLGEIGLDHRFVEDAAQHPAQRRVFEHFLAAARAQRKIVNLHTSGAEAEVLDLLRAFAVERTIVHWYAGPLDVLDGFIGHGAYFTLGVEVLTSRPIQEIVRRIPADRLLTETDNPRGLEWLTGAIGMPGILAEVVAVVAGVRGTTSAAIRGAVAENLARLLWAGPNPDAVETWWSAWARAG
jgi:TatD DNase family protein